MLPFMLGFAPLLAIGILVYAYRLSQKEDRYYRDRHDVISIERNKLSAKYDAMKEGRA